MQSLELVSSYEFKEMKHERYGIELSRTDKLQIGSLKRTVAGADELKRPVLGFSFRIDACPKTELTILSFEAENLGVGRHFDLLEIG